MRGPSAPTSFRILNLLCIFVGGAILHSQSQPSSVSASHEKASLDGKVDFVKDVQPILEKRCYGCHGPQQQMGQLRLDSRRGVLSGGVSGPVILTGQGKESLLYQRIAGLGGQPQMPLAGKKLPAEQMALVSAWIDQGAQLPQDYGPEVAENQKHWAYVRPLRPPLPAVTNQSWTRNPIDHFILARLESEGLHPSPEASKEKLIRRVSLDLTGLPPTPAELDAFLADSGTNSYEKVVDRLLASPNYGERWAVPWLDLARYADSNGYGNDWPRSMWLYRDWVIEALNADMPFDQFTIEQIAGDLLPDSTLQQRIATGFHRNTMINDEAGTDPEEFRMGAVLDRVNTTATVWLGSTLACAQCHNHKFDPFLQEEYYRLVAFFNNTEEEVDFNKRSNKPTARAAMTVPSIPRMAPLRQELEDEILRLESESQGFNPELEKAQVTWERQMKAVVAEWEVLKPSNLLSLGDATLTLQSDNSVLAGGTNPDQEVYVVLAETRLQKITGLRLEALTHRSLPRKGSSRSANGNFVLTGFEVEAAPLGQPSRAVTVELTNAVADYSQKDMQALYAIDEDARTGWAIDGDKENFQVARQIVFIPKHPIAFPGGAQLRIRLRHESGSAQQTIGRFRLSLTTESSVPGKIIKLPAKLQPILSIPKAQRTTTQQQEMAAYHRSVAPLLKPLRDRVGSLRRQLKEVTAPTVLLMKDLAEPRVTYVHEGGNFRNPGKKVTPGVPAILHLLPKQASLDRLTLARWLVDKENPLVARVTVNRSWMELFVRGLVNTPEDFGTRADPPSHRELLDWLATEFMQQGWSMKAMHRMMVTSATYRQDSRITPELLEKDPENKLWARSPRFRLSGEMIRDTALAISKLLSRRMGGPSVFPWQPEGIWPMFRPDDIWVNSGGENRYRRSFYTYWRRTTPYPAFATFDAPSREVCVVKRARTNTPLQSLTTLNDPAYFQMARGLARRLLVEAGPDTRQKIAYAFRICLSRAPAPEEVNRLARFFEQERSRFILNPVRARKTAFGLDFRLPEKTDAAEFAAWTLLANVLLNLDETLTRG